MAITKDFAIRLSSLPLPQPFSVCELGDQGMCGVTKDKPAKDWYPQIGCNRYVSIDGNGRGTITADLNQPLNLCFLDFPGGEFTHREPIAFDLVTDFGTGEHIFDQAQVWRTVHQLTKPGGYIAFDRPAQGYQKHCFYLTNETLFFDIAEANGYEFLWFDRKQMERGELIRGIYRRPMTSTEFRNPQQGKYKPDLVIS